MYALGARPERILERRTLRRHELRAIRGDDHVILESHAKLARNVDPRLVAERHARLELLCVALPEVRPLVAVHADAVADAVREVLVARAEAGVRDDLAGGGVHRLTLDARARRLECRRLRLVLDLEHLFHPVRRLA